ncbi:Aste57867_14949 [Aphanomyces stellatus]|uniref:Aste57867_14949 protein n=1 Tax=Aphanomyces stellatus TaxID=120398 RepID=A0A485L201_9STRA|nr:hypothetical protein As57867_014893 [Aphanomyces stellatus]VFT91763.1 Aste57867_14949 [Aphanomyces stellatus]
MSSFMSNMVISMVLMVVVQNAVNSYFGFETPAICKEGTNDMTWLGESYDSDFHFHPKSVVRSSHYIPTFDGVQLAADLYISEQATGRDLKQPTVVHFTRHGRGYTLDFPMSKITAGGNFINPRTAAYITRLATTSFAWLVVDIRGTGASYGSKEFDFSDQEAKDAKDVFDWITAQPWSNGDVTAFGFGLDGVSALVAATSGHPALKAVALSGVPTDLYDAAFFPGGLHNAHMASQYSSFCAATDANKRWDGVPHFKARLMMSTFGGNIFPVNTSEPQVLAAAVAEHDHNGVFNTETKNVQFRDDKLASLDKTFAQIDVPRLFEKLAKSNVAILNMAGYYDMGTARSSILLHRYLTRQLDADSARAYGLTTLPAADVPSTKYKLILGPWSHSNVDNIDPFAEAKTRCFEHIEEISRFFDYHVYPEERKAMTHLEEEDSIHYYTLAEGKWKSTSTWPPASIDETLTYYLSLNNTMVEEPAEVIDGEQSHEFKSDFSLLSGVTTRWSAIDHIFLNKPSYAHDRFALSSNVIHFATPAVHQMEATGEMTLKVYFSANKPDVSLAAYLEDWNNVPPIEHQVMHATKVKVRGGVTYITEGVVDPKHQTIAPGNPLRTFLQSDARTIEPDVVYEATFNFYPTSYFVSHKHQLRVSIAATEAAVLDARSADKATKLTIHFSEQYPSALTIKAREVPLPERIVPAKKEPTAKVADAPVAKEEDEFAVEEEAVVVEEEAVAEDKKDEL